MPLRTLLLALVIGAAAVPAAGAAASGGRLPEGAGVASATSEASPEPAADDDASSPVDGWIEAVLSRETDLPTRLEAWRRLLEAGAGSELVRRARRTAQVIVEVDAPPDVAAPAVTDLELHAGDRVEVFFEGYSQGVLIHHDGRWGWIDPRLLAEGELPEPTLLPRRIRDALDRDSWVDALRPLQILVNLHGTDPADVPLPTDLVRFLARFPRLEARGIEMEAMRREVEHLEPQAIVADPAPEVVARVREVGYEWIGESLEIHHGLGGPGPPRRFRIRTLSDDHTGPLRRAWVHAEDLDADDDRELVVLSGTSGLATPADDARTWRVTLYDHDGIRFVPVPWTRAMRSFLERRVEEAEDPLELAILRSHLGPAR